MSEENKLGILIGAELDREKFQSDMESQLKGLQKILEDKKLKVSVDIDTDTSSMENAKKKIKKEVLEANKDVGTLNVSNNMDKQLESSSKALEKLKKDASDYKKTLADMTANEKSLIKAEEAKFNQRRKQSAIGQAKKSGLRIPNKDDENYEYWKSITTTESRSKLTKNGHLKTSKRNAQSLDDYAKENGLDSKQFMDEIAKGFEKFDLSKVNEDALKAINQIRDSQEETRKKIEETSKILEKQEEKYKKIQEIKQRTNEADAKQREKDAKELDEIDKALRKIEDKEKLVNHKEGNYKVTSEATKTVGREVTGKIVNKEDEYGNKIIKRLDKDGNEESTTTILNLKRLEEAEEKYGIKHQKWTERLAELNNKAFKINDSGLDKINAMTKQLNEMDATTKRIQFDKFENELKGLEKTTKDNIKAFDELEKKKKELNGTAQGLRDNNLIDEGALERYKKQISDINNNDKNSNKQIESLQNELAYREKIEKSHKNAITTQEGLNKKELSNQEKIDKAHYQAFVENNKREQAKFEKKKKRIEEEQKLEKQKFDAVNKIKKAEIDGKVDPDRAQNYKNIVNNAKLKDGQTAISNTEIDRVNKYLKQLDLIDSKGKTATKTKERLNKKLIDLTMSGKVAEEQLKEFDNSIKTTKSVTELKKLEDKIDDVIEKKKLSETVHARQELKPIQGFDGVSKVTDKDIKNALALNDAYKNRKILSTSVNTVTGEWTARIRENGQAERELKGVIDSTTGALVRQGEKIQDTTNKNLGFIEQFKIAMQRVPLWAGAMTLIYGSKNALQDMVNVVIDLDTQMTELKRVMSEETNFNNMLQQSIEMSKELGNNLTDVNNAVIGFARQGFNEQEALDMGRTAVIASNVSDMTADETMSDLTAIMTQFNIEAENSISIIDKLNEVDNNFAITTRDLADATSKAGATAQTFGVDLDEMLGHVTAIGVATRESGSVIGNSLKSIYSRITTVPEAINSLKELGISIKDSSGEMRSAKTIIDDLYDQWENLSKAQQQNLGVTIAGRQQLSRFLAMMNNYKMGLDATETAMNSQGSAMSENEKYMESMQAQINRLKVAWMELANATGENVLGATFIGIVKTLTGLAEAVTKLSKTFGTLPIVMTIVGIGLILLSKNVRTYATSVFQASTHTKLFSKALTLLGMAVDKVTNSFKALLSATVFLAVFAVIGYAVEKLIGHIVKVNKEQKELEKQQNKIADSYNKSSKKINELVEEYNKLKEITIKTTKEKERFKDVQNELANLMPNLVKKFDEEGNAHLKNADAIKKELEYAKKLADTKKAKDLENSEEKFDKELKKRQKIIDKLKETEKAQSKLKDGTLLRTSGLNEGDAGYEAELDKANKKYYILEMQRVGLEKQLADMEGSVRKSVQKMTLNFIELSETEIDLTGMKEQINDLYKSVDEKVLAGLGGEGLSKLSGELGKSIIDFKQAVVGGSEKEINKIGKELQKLIHTSLGKSEIEAEQFIYTLQHGKEAVREYNESLITQLSSMDELKKSYDEVKDSMSAYNGLLEKVAKGKSLTTTEAMDLITKENALADAISIENGQIAINIEAVEALRVAKKLAFSESLDAKKEEIRVEAEVLQTKLQNYGIEIQAIESLQDAKNALNGLEESRAERLSRIRSIKEGEVISAEYADAERKIKGIKDAYNAIERLGEIANSSLNDVGTDRETTKDTKEKTYVVDEYAKALEKVNNQIEKHNRIQEKTLKHSKRYQDSLKQELAWLEKKNAILKEQSKDLANQIKTGNIKEYGMITSNNNVVTSTSATTTSTGGYNGKYADIINQASSKYGINPNLIAAMIRQESNFNPNVVSSAGAVGLMQLMPKTAQSLGVKDSKDPYQNIMGGTKYIAQQLEKFGGSIEKALIAYNAGPGRVNKVLNSGSGSWKEPKNYVKKVTGYMDSYGGGSTSSPKSNAVANYYLNSGKFRVSSQFGEKRGKDSHGGLDLAPVSKKAGDLIKAVRGGKVTVAGRSGTAGNWVVIEQDDGTVAKYMHMLKKPNVKAGQKVSAGDTLGQVGDTGDSYGDHLHLQIEKNGKKIDPLNYLKTLNATASSSVDNAEADMAQLLDQAQGKYEDIGKQIKENQDAMEALKEEITMSYTYPFDEAIRKQDVLAQRLALGTYHMVTSSKEYRTELEKQREALQKKQRIIEQENTLIRNMLKTTKMAESTRYKLQLKLDELNSMKYQNASDRDAITWSIIQSELEKYTKVYEKYTYQLSKNKALQEQVNKESNEYKKLLKEEIELINKQRHAILEQVNILEKSIHTQKLTKEQQEELRRQVQSLMLEYYNLGNAMSSIKASMADDAINVLKKAYEKQKELAIKAIDAELKEAEKAHKKKMDMLDEEMEQYEKAIRLKIRGYDDQISKDAYDKNLSKLQKEEMDLQKRIDILALDNSQDAIAKRIELEEQLKLKKEEIEQAKYDREMELKKQSLQDSLDAKKEEIDNIKEKEQEKYDNLVDVKNDEKDLIESNYKEIMANEKYWNNMRKQLLEGNVQHMSEQLKKFLDEFGSYNESTVKELESTWTELQSLIESIKNSMSDMDKIPGIDSNGSSNGFGEDANEKIKAWQKYLSNKRKSHKVETQAERDKLRVENDELRKKWGFIDGSVDELEKIDISQIANKNGDFQKKVADWSKYLKNKKIYSSSSYEKRQQLIKENAQLRTKWKFPDGAWQDLEKLQIHADGIYHDGGIISGKGSRMGEILNTLANTKPNEQMVKALKGELMIPEKNFPNFINNTAKAILGAVPQGGNVVSPKTYEINFNIANLNGTEKEAESFASYTIKKLKRSGIL